MPSKKKPVATLPSIPKLIDQFVSDSMGTEFSHHLGYPPGTEKLGELKTTAMVSAARPC